MLAWGLSGFCQAGDVEQENPVQPQGLGLGFRVVSFLGFYSFWGSGFLGLRGRESHLARQHITAVMISHPPRVSHNIVRQHCGQRQMG